MGIVQGWDRRANTGTVNQGDVVVVSAEAWNTMMRRAEQAERERDALIEQITNARIVDIQSEVDAAALKRRMLEVICDD